MKQQKPDAWRYEEFATNGELRAMHVWTFLPEDLQQTVKLKDVDHIKITPLYANESESRIFNKQNKYNSKKLAEAYGGL